MTTGFLLLLLQGWGSNPGHKCSITELYNPSPNNDHGVLEALKNFVCENLMPAGSWLHNLSVNAVEQT